MIKIYGRAGCSSCDQAKALCESNGVSYEYLSLGKDYQLSEFMSIKEGHRSFPLITKDDEYIGGLVELKESLYLLMHVMGED